MSQVRDYGLEGANTVQLDTSQSPVHVDLEAQSPRSPVQSQEKENRRPVSPNVSLAFRVIPY